MSSSSRRSRVRNALVWFALAVVAGACTGYNVATYLIWDHWVSLVAATICGGVLVWAVIEVDLEWRQQ